CCERSSRVLWRFSWPRRLRARSFAMMPAISDQAEDARKDAMMTMRDRIERDRTEGVVFLALFGLTIPAANWLIGHVGTVCVPQGPCLVPVLPGLMAPSGVMMIGIALVLRDLVQRRLGLGVSAAAVLAGAALSALLAPPALVIASAVAFLLSELADLA